MTEGQAPEEPSGKEPSDAKKKMPKWLKICLIALISVIGLAAVAAVAGFAYYQHIFNQIVLPETEDNIIPPESEDFVTDDPNDPVSWFIDDETTDDATPEDSSSADSVSESYMSDSSAENGDDISGTDKPSDSMTAPGKSNLTSESPVYQDPASVVWPEDMTPLGDDGLINIMLVGQDNNNFRSRGRSDSMILLSVNPSTGGIVLVSFLRDLYVQIGNGYSDNRLNVAYKFGGFPLMFDVMKRNFGITCDYGVVVNFDSFRDIINILGGVDLSFTEKEVRYLVKNKTATYPDGSVIKIGLNKNVPGDIALAYARTRKIDSDFSRTARQRKLLLSVYNRFKNASLSTILELVGNVTNYIRIYGMTSTGLLNLVRQLYPLIGNEVKGYSVPGSGEYSYARMRGMSVVMPNLTKIRTRLAKILPLGSGSSVTVPPVTIDKPEESSTQPPETTPGLTDPDTSQPPETATSELPTDTETSATPTETETSAMPSETEMSDLPPEPETSDIPTDTATSETPTEPETSGTEGPPATVDADSGENMPDTTSAG